jgi:hypothetical protein
MRTTTTTVTALATSLLGGGLALAEPIRDNSFLIEEAYNQEPGVVQHISTLELGDGAWAYGFTQEWPVVSQRHQVSVHLPLGDSGGGAGLGDVALTYRAQLSGIEGGTAFAPALSLALPTGAAADGMGDGGPGVSLNLPVSVELGERLALHGNLGGAVVFGGENAMGDAGSPTRGWLGGSAIWLVHPRFNLMAEALWSRTGVIAGPDRIEGEDALVLSPGVRGAVDVGGLQIVPGLALPVGVGPSAGELGVFGYLSFEHAFRRR